MNPEEVYTAENEVEAFFIKGLLESRGIKCSVQAIPGPRGIVAFGQALLPHTISVGEGKAEEAKKVLSEANEK